MSPGVKKIREIKTDDGDTVVRLEPTDDGRLKLTWGCQILHWSPEDAHEQMERLELFVGRYEGVWLADKCTTGVRWFARGEKGKLEVGQSPRPHYRCSWANFKKGFAGVLKQLPAPQPRKDEVME